jgi:hypothetical protein
MTTNSRHHQRVVFYPLRLRKNSVRRFCDRFAWPPDTDRLNPDLLFRLAHR